MPTPTPPPLPESSSPVRLPPVALPTPPPRGSPFIDWGPALPDRYGDEAIRLIAQSSRQLFGYWEAPGAATVDLELREGTEGTARLLARGLPATGEYWIGAEPDRRYRIALLVNGETRLLSNEARTPRDRPSDEIEPPAIAEVTPPGAAEWRDAPGWTPGWTPGSPRARR